MYKLTHYVVLIFWPNVETCLSVCTGSSDSSCSGEIIFLIGRYVTLAVPYIDGNVAADADW